VNGWRAVGYIFAGFGLILLIFTLILVVYSTEQTINLGVYTVTNYEFPYRGYAWVPILFSALSFVVAAVGLYAGSQEKQ
jgi:hypothetical protein